MNSSNSKGFILIELIIVIAIIAILSAIVIPIYQRYQQKSKIASFALPLVRACAGDALTFCMSNRVSGVSNITMNVTSLPNCKNATATASGSLNMTITGTFTCEASGHISNGTVTGELEGVSLYKAQCTLNQKSINCQVLPKF
ncbi:MAG: prepilin-type N-terminal cleavage/methylation domain-containing protein [Caldimicrobium sp.]